MNQYSCFSLIYIVLLSESFWTASNDTYVSCIHWINSLVLRSVLQDSLEVLCLKYLKHLIVCFTSSSVMRELNETVRNMNDFAMSLTFTWEDERKNFSCNISIFFLNIIVIWSMLLRFNDENWKSFLNSWLSILAHFAKHYIDLSASFSLCICDLKCVHFICRMILFLWSLCFRYLFHASNISCIFHMICNRLDFITTLKQLWFQKFLAQFNDFVKRVDFLMIFCSTLIILHTLSFIIVLSSKEWFKDRCIHR